MSTQETNAQERTGEQENPQPTTIAELQEDIERTRERLGETVDELSHRLDVKARAHDKVTDIKAAAQEKAVDVKSVVSDKTSAITSQVSDVGARVKPLAQRREVQAAAGGAMLLGVGAAVIAHRRGK
ncbi:MAG TPA: DUF3618 domain-containing protein [Sporichthya sp.]|nr:DUF3618 domain-containing protein [Sporichthya sp.]